MLDRQQLEAFAAVVEALSFERAAERLNVTRGAISQRIKALEEALAASVLVRDKPLSLTPVGEVLFKHVAALRLLEAETFGRIRPQAAPGRSATPLAIGVDAHVLDTWFCQVARRLMERNTVDLEVVVDDSDPAFPQLTRGEIIGCISTVPHPARGCAVTPLGGMEYRCVANAEFQQRCFPNGFTLHAARAAPAVLLGRRTALLDRLFESVFGVTVGRYRKHFLPSAAAQLDAILGGLGYGPVPERAAHAHLASGRLVDVLCGIPYTVPLYWHHWRAAPPVCESISAEVVACAREMLRAGGGQPAALPDPPGFADPSGPPRLAWAV